MSHAIISSTIGQRIARCVSIATGLFGVAWIAGLASAQDSGTTMYAADGTRPVDRHPLFTFDLRLGYDSNVNSTYSNKIGSGFFNVGGGVIYTAGSPRSTLTLGAGAGVSYYFDQGPNNENYTVNANINLTWTYKISQRMILNIATYNLYTSEPNFQLVGVNNTISGNYFYSANRLGLTYQWTPRFSTVVGYNPVFYLYQDQPYKEQQDRVEQYFALELRYLVIPTVSLVGEYRFGYVDYFYNNIGSANLNSTTNYALGGLDVSLSPRLKFVFRTGAEFRDFNNSNQPSTSSPFFEGRLNYLYMRDSSLTFIARYGLEEPFVTGYRYQEAFRLGLEINQRITRRITSYAAFYYVNSFYQGLQTPFSLFPPPPNFHENTYNLSLGVRYSFNRHFAFDIGYLYTTAQSQILVRSYDRNRVFAGVHFQF